MAGANTGYLIRESLRDLTLLEELTITGVVVHSALSADASRDPDLLFTGIEFAVTDSDADVLAHRIAGALLDGGWSAVLETTTTLYRVHKGSVLTYAPERHSAT